MYEADSGKNRGRETYCLVTVSQIDQCPTGHCELRQVNIGGSRACQKKRNDSLVG